MDFQNIILTISGLYAISSLIEEIIETPKEIKTIKSNKEKYQNLYHTIEKFIQNNQTIKGQPLNQLKKTSYPQELQKIIIQFKQYVDSDNFDNCLQRLYNLQINYITITKDIKKYLQNAIDNEGTYNPQNNTINIYKIFDKQSVLTHEFLHMASTNQNSDSGFCTTINNTLIGRGLDEGYTELLNKRIFKPKNTAYTNIVEIVELLEIIFDNKKQMEYAYFHNNIFIIYQTFLKYGTKKEFCQIIQTLDNLIDTDIPIYKKIATIKTKLYIYTILKRSKNKEKIAAAEQLLEKDSLIKLLKNKNIILANKPKYKTKIKQKKWRYKHGCAKLYFKRFK